MTATVTWKYGTTYLPRFENDGNGNYTTLKQKNIDTGMGLERLAVIVQDVDSIFDVDTICSLRNLVSRISGKPYGVHHEDDVPSV